MKDVVGIGFVFWLIIQWIGCSVCQAVSMLVRVLASRLLSLALGLLFSLSVGKLASNVNQSVS